MFWRHPLYDKGYQPVTNFASIPPVLEDHVNQVLQQFGRSPLRRFIALLWADDFVNYLDTVEFDETLFRCVFFFASKFLSVRLSSACTLKTYFCAMR